MSSNDCKTVQTYLSAYHDGELSDGQTEAVSRHIESCDLCATELRAFRLLGAAFRQAPIPSKSSDLWLRIERALPSRGEPVTWSRRLNRWVRESRSAVGTVSVAASVLVLIGFGLWYAQQRRGGNGDAMGGALAADAHDSTGGVAPENMAAENMAAENMAAENMAAENMAAEVMDEHMAEFTSVMGDYLRRLPSDPDGAEQLLLDKYQGQKVDADSAVKLVGYRPIVSRGLPDGYSLASTSVLKMPCCVCFKAVCKRGDGSTLVLFEHDDETTAWFGDHPASMVTCGDKACCLVNLDSSLAATWKQGSRSVTAVGARDRDEVAKLVKWLDPS